METCVAERFSDCTSHVKDWIKGLEAQGFYLGASRYSWGAPIPK
ncbi:hypothetical protein [Paenimyroides tangerinum]|nr:hypothetical protein [Paenimyroides tangerinum]